MPVLHLLHGLPGSGKTTFARRLARELPAVRFTPDEWMIALHGTNPALDLFREQHPKIMALIWEHAARVLQTGADVILDTGCWSRASRDDARTRAAALAVSVRLYAMDCPVELARQRLLERTAARPDGALVIDAAAFEQFNSQFEPLGTDEPHLMVAESDPPLP